jgi:DNA polymerase III alpha subunit (gram-positive type)
MLKDFIILDVEATGIDPRLNEIIEFAAIRVKDFSIVDRF